MSKQENINRYAKIYFKALYYSDDYYDFIVSKIQEHEEVLGYLHKQTEIIDALYEFYGDIYCFEDDINTQQKADDAWDKWLEENSDKLNALNEDQVCACIMGLPDTKHRDKIFDQVQQAINKAIARKPIYPFEVLIGKLPTNKQMGRMERQLDIYLWTRLQNHSEYKAIEIANTEGG